MLTTLPRLLASSGALTQIFCVGLSVWSVLSGSSLAQDKGVVAAASAFTQAQQAELTGDHTRAAELFELADRIAPTPEALRSAARERLAAGHLVAAASDAEELLRRYPNDEAARELANKIFGEARPALMRATLQCSDPCTVIVDGLAASLAALDTQIVYLSPGTHQLTIGFEQGLERGLRLTGAAGEARSLRISKPDPLPEAKPEVAKGAGASVGSSVSAERRDIEPGRGLATTYFWVATGLTVATGAVALWSGLDLLKARDDFEADKQPTRADFDAGEQKDLRTTVLLGAAGALAVGTAALAAFTNFRSRRRESASLQLGPRAAGLSYRATF